MPLCVCGCNVHRALVKRVRVSFASVYTSQEDVTDLLERYPELVDTLKKLSHARANRYDLACPGVFPRRCVIALDCFPRVAQALILLASISQAS